MGTIRWAKSNIHIFLGGLVGVLICLLLFFFYLKIYFPYFKNQNQNPKWLLIPTAITGHIFPLLSGFLIGDSPITPAICTPNQLQCVNWSAKYLSGCNSPYTFEDPDTGKKTVGCCVEQILVPNEQCREKVEQAGTITISGILLAVYFFIGSLFTKLFWGRKRRLILITGMPFSGKTYVSEYLKKAGVNALDADKIPGLGNWHDQYGNKVIFNKNANQEWLKNHHYLWDKNILRRWLKKQKQNTYLFGLAENVLQCADLFSEVYYLSLTPEILQKRFQVNTRTNAMGKTPEQRIAILRDLMSFTEQAKTKGLIFIPADSKPEEIYNIIK